MWDLPRTGLEPVSPALAGRLSTTAPPGKPRKLVFYCANNTVIRTETSKIGERDNPLTHYLFPFLFAPSCCWLWAQFWGAALITDTITYSYCSALWAIRICHHTAFSFCYLLPISGVHTVLALLPQDWRKMPGPCKKGCPVDNVVVVDTCHHGAEESTDCSAIT